MKVGAIALRLNKKNNPEICFVSSNRHDELLTLPKGIKKQTETCPDTALRELFEEAGICGDIIQKHRPWLATSNKIDGDEEVLYFGVWIKSQNTEWPESEKRKRKFLTLKKALKKPLSFGSRKVLNTIQKAMLHSKKNIVQVMGIETLHKKSKATKPKTLAA
jgi:8-oxo-dGTP pyrophosphatase MutT (NUDIX family)